MKRGRVHQLKQTFRGYLFIWPFIIGVCAFFLYPLGEAITYAFCHVQIQPGSMHKTFAGLSILKEVFLQDPEPIQLIASSLWDTIVNSFLVLVFSLGMALVLNQNFRGRGLARTIFALPIIVSTGIFLSIFKEDLTAQSISLAAEGTVFQATAIRDFLIDSGFAESFVEWLTGFISKTLDLIWLSGVQILLLLGGLQSIPRQLYEVSRVEGATGWQIFWDLVFPWLSPYFLLTAVYTVIDSFMNYGNPVMKRIMEQFANLKYEQSTTFALGYCLLVLVLVGIVTAFLSRRTYYTES